MRTPYWLTLVGIAALGLCLTSFLVLLGPGFLFEIPIVSPSPQLPISTETAHNLTPTFAHTQEPAPLPSPTQFPSPTGIATQLPPTATEDESCAAVEFIRDVTIPDGSVVRRGQEFTKTWRLKNTGTCDWDSRYQLAFVRGSAMNSELSIPLAGPVLAGETVDVSSSMVAPDKPGTYTGYWMLRNPEGALFGVGEHSDGWFWVTVTVTMTGDPEPGGPASEKDLVIEEARQFLAAQLNVNPEQITVVDAEDAVWYDTCLGITLSSEFDCNPAPEGIDGYSIRMEFKGRTYEVHSNLTGSYVYWKTL